MKCQRCGGNEATIHYIEIEEEQKTHLWICEDCAREEGIAADLADLEDAPQIAAGSGAEGLDVFLGGLLDDEEAAAAADQPDENVVCASCGFSYDQLQETGQLGCPACYETFRTRILPMLRRYHREIGHVGKAPRTEGSRASQRRELHKLKAALEEAIAREAFEEAARLRDAIKQKELTLTTAPETEDGVEPPEPEE